MTGSASSHSAASPEREPFQGVALTVSLTVGHVLTSLAWYRDVLGFTVEREHERDGAVRAASLRAGEVRILISQDDGAAGLERAKGGGFSLMITTGQDVDEIARFVREAGGALLTEPSTTPWGARMFRVLDPDGFRLVISSQQDSR